MKIIRYPNDSYNCVGCLGTLSTLVNINAQGTSAAFPIISELNKLPNLMKEPPKAVATTTLSICHKKLTFFFFV